MATETLLRDLEPTVESLLERHLNTAKEWFPHELVPYSRGRDAVPGHQWTEDDADLEAARQAGFGDLVIESPRL